MPCRDWLDEETSAADERIKNLKSDMQKIRAKMNKLTRLLCEAGTIMAEQDRFGPDGLLHNKMSKELKDWLWEHNKEDRKR